jgi:hypothetical protein
MTATEHARAIDEVVSAVESIAVRVAQFDQGFLASVGIDAEDLVQGLVADVEETGRIPHGAFREAESGCHLRQPSAAIDELPERGRPSGQLKLTGGFGTHRRAQEKQSAAGQAKLPHQRLSVYAV